MNSVIDFPHEVGLCTAYVNYLKSGLAKEATNRLIQTLDECNLLAQAAALQAFLQTGEGWYKNLPLTKPWQGMPCFVGQLPPAQKDLGTLWFDPHELSFMTRITNPPRIGTSVRGWLGIEPVLRWQYHAFITLSNIENKHSPFLMVDDLFKARPESQTNYMTNIYELEAGIYSRWHGKWLACRFEFESALYCLPVQQVEAIFPQGYSFWDPSLSGAEELSGYFSCDTFRDKTQEDIKAQYEAIMESIKKEVCSEWFRDRKISMIMHLSDQLGLTPVSSYPIEDEYVRLKNCVRKI